jgi:PAS domain S-box-containing protein
MQQGPGEGASQEAPSGSLPDEAAPEIRFRELLEGVGAAIFALDTDGRFQFVNEQALDLLGYHAGQSEELVGAHFSKILDPKQASIAADLFQSAREIRPLVIAVRRRDGSALSVEVSGAWVRRRGRRVGALAMAWPIASPPAAEGATPALSKLDMTILHLVSTGLSNREIAARVYLSTHTVKDRIEKLMRQFGVSRRAQLAATAARRGLV